VQHDVANGAHVKRVLFIAQGPYAVELIDSLRLI